MGLCEEASLIDQTHLSDSLLHSAIRLLYSLIHSAIRVLHSLIYSAIRVLYSLIYSAIRLLYGEIMFLSIEKKKTVYSVLIVYINI